MSYLLKIDLYEVLTFCISSIATVFHQAECTGFKALNDQIPPPLNNRKGEVLETKIFCVFSYPPGLSCPLLHLIFCISNVSCFSPFDFSEIMF